MAENMVITLKTEKPGGLWPFVRGCFAWIGFSVVVVAGASIVNNPGQQEAFRAGWQAYQAAYRAKANPYGQAPVNPFDGMAFDPVPKAKAEPEPVGMGKAGSAQEPPLDSDFTRGLIAGAMISCGLPDAPADSTQKRN